MKTGVRSVERLLQLSNEVFSENYSIVKLTDKILINLRMLVKIVPQPFSFREEDCARCYGAGVLNTDWSQGGQAKKRGEGGHPIGRHN